ncbi:hypothetical protein ABEY43_06245 [Priestia megaterium]
MKKEYFGYLGGDYEKLGLFINKKDAERGMFPDGKLDELFEEFKEKPVKITVETFESVEDATDEIKITSDSGVGYQSIKDYSIMADKFKNSSQIKVNDEEIQLRVTKEDYDELKDNVEVHKAATIVQVDDIQD